MEPFRVMLVDDEIMAIRHVKAMADWEAFGFRVVAEAITARQALDMTARTHPDLIFMDIRMPAMDGLEVSKRILAQGRQPEIYLLTSYQDFAYAKEALSLGIGGYILKHDMNEEYLKKELAEIGLKLREKRKQERIATMRFFKDLLSGSAAAPQLPPQLEAQLGGKAGIVLFYLVADTAFPVMDYVAEAAPSLPEWTDEQDFEERYGLTHIGTVEQTPGKRLMLFAASELHSEEIRQRHAHFAASDLQNAAVCDRITWSVFVSRLCKRPADIVSEFRGMERAAAYLVWLGKASIVQHSALSLPSVDENAAWRTLHRAILQRPQETDAASLLCKIAAAFDYMQAGQFHPSLLNKVCYSLLLQLEQLRASAGLPAYTEATVPGEEDERLWYSLPDIRRWFVREAEAISSHTEASGPYSHNVKKIIEHIHEHYGDDLTLETIGKALSFSGDHIRHLFKEETGRTVTDYLIGYRVEMAKRLLWRDQYKIYEIAERVGYRSSQYFSHVFKKWTGQTPQEYKDTAR